MLRLGGHGRAGQVSRKWLGNSCLRKVSGVRGKTRLGKRVWKEGVRNYCLPGACHVLFLGFLKEIGTHTHTLTHVS